MLTRLTESIPNLPSFGHYTKYKIKRLGNVLLHEMHNNTNILLLNAAMQERH